MELAYAVLLPKLSPIIAPSHRFSRLQNDSCIPEILPSNVCHSKNTQLEILSERKCNSSAEKNAPGKQKIKAQSHEPMRQWCAPTQISPKYEPYNDPNCTELRVAVQHFQILLLFLQQANNPLESSQAVKQWAITAFQRARPL
jgi:hypothetical protein